MACSGSNGDQQGGTPVATASDPTELPVEGIAALYGVDAGDNAGGLATGDFNGDKQVDVVLAGAFADGPENARPDAGEAWIFFGPIKAGEVRDAAGGQVLTIFGADEGDQAGRAVAAGDFNGDGVDDIIVGAPFGDGPGGDRKDAGEVHVVLGNAGFRPGARHRCARRPSGFSVYGRGEENFAGFALATANLNGDGATDLVIGAFWSAGPGGDRSQAGEVYTIFGGPNRVGALDLGSRRTRRRGPGRAAVRPPG